MNTFYPKRFYSFQLRARSDISVCFKYLITNKSMCLMSKFLNLSFDLMVITTIGLVVIKLKLLIPEKKNKLNVKIIIAATHSCLRNNPIEFYHLRDKLWKQFLYQLS